MGHASSTSHGPITPAALQWIKSCARRVDRCLVLLSLASRGSFRGDFKPQLFNSARAKGTGRPPILFTRSGVVLLLLLLLLP